MEPKKVLKRNDEGETEKRYTFEVVEQKQVEDNESEETEAIVAMLQ